jgi:predicted transcriptional regulator
MQDERWRSEQERRDLAQAHAGELVSETSSEVAAREMKQMISVRLEPELVSSLRELARKRGATMSEVLREAAQLLLASADTSYAYFEVTSQAFEAPSLPGVQQWTGNRL